MAILKLDDALWAGETIEPRILELIPAIMLKKPIFFKYKTIPDDLKKILLDIKKNKATDEFRGIPVKKYIEWIEHIGHKNKSTSLLKTFRFSKNDVILLNKLKSKLNLSEIDILRLGLQKL